MMLLFTYTAETRNNATRERAILVPTTLHLALKKSGIFNFISWQDRIDFRYINSFLPIFTVFPSLGRKYAPFLPD